MAMRNWWIDATVDGRKTPLASGPRSKDGGFSLAVAQRDVGTSVQALTVEGHVAEDGTLTLRVYDDRGVLVHSFQTTR